MLRRRSWSWWFGLMLCLAAVATLGQDLWGHRHPEMEDLSVFAAFVLATIFFFLPGVRNYLVLNNAVAIKERSTETP